ncbi:tRNAHis guanylyltransferase-domain-containing protein [Cyathus striatus]|nr:tRNAHis guanylyltransferase-domain-containing protein [Cyathus striatus]
MANSKFAYVRSFELPDPLLPNTYLVFRLDGHSFHRFSDEHGFAKPNDKRALELMDCAAQEVMREYPDIVLGFGESDEYSFLLRKQTSLYSRRQSKIVSTLTSYFTSNYVFHWSRFFPDTPLKYPPSFDGRIVLYPGTKEVRDYFAWRQADTHINNMYNTVFWALVLKGGKTTTEAHAVLRLSFVDRNWIGIYATDIFTEDALRIQARLGLDVGHPLDGRLRDLRTVQKRVLEHVFFINEPSTRIAAY